MLYSITKCRATISVIVANLKYILAIDQGTSATKSLLFDEAGCTVARGSEPLFTSYMHNGFVEQGPEDIYKNVLTSVKKCLQNFSEGGYHPVDIAAIGISNQRETFVIWDKNGKPFHPAIVWQCKRSVQICEELNQQDLSGMIQQKTGLVIDPYFSATKLIWLLRNHEYLKQAVKNGQVYFGTVDTWLLYKFTQGNVFATDYTNASRTLLFNLHTLQWDEELIAAFGLTGLHLPVIKPSACLFGETILDGLFNRAIPVTAIIGDSHAAAVGEGCFETGTAKVTLGTGCSILMNIGDKPLTSKNGMVTTICWSMENRVDYAYEGVIVSCGATLEWLKKGLNIIEDSKVTAAMAAAVKDNGGVFLIPAFSGLGSPYWQMERRASITGMSFGTTKNHIVRAALEAIPYQIMDVITAMEKDAELLVKELHANGGISSNHFVMQLLADLLNKKVTTGNMPDVSAWGAAFLAGLQTGAYVNIEAIKQLNSGKQCFQPADDGKAVKNYTHWQKLIHHGYAKH